MTILTEKKLKYNLSTLHSMLLPLNYTSIDKICFFNISSFYDFLDKINNYKYNTSNMVNSIIMCIPLCSYKDDNTIKLFKSSLNTYDLGKIRAFKELLYKKSIINFLSLLLQADNEKDFSTIFNACNNIRKSL